MLRGDFTLQRLGPFQGCIFAKPYQERVPVLPQPKTHQRLTCPLSDLQEALNERQSNSEAFISSTRPYLIPDITLV